MYGVVIKRIVLIGGFLSSIICFIWNMLCERELLHAAFVSLCVMLIVSSILNIGLLGIARILLKFLHEQQNQIDFSEDSNIKFDPSDRN